MSVLLIQLPTRPHLPAGGAPNASSLRAPTAWRYVWSNHGEHADRSGVAATGLLPKADSVVAVLPAAELSWQRLPLPRAPANKLRAALVGALEEQLLDDAELLHFALPAKAEAGALTWVAVAHKAWLQQLLQALEEAGRTVDRVVPEAAPVMADAATAIGHFHGTNLAPMEVAADATASALSETADPQPWLTLSTREGCCQLKLSGGFASHRVKALLSGSSHEAESSPLQPARWTATAAAAGAAEAWLLQQGLDQRVDLVSDGQHLLQAHQSPWNLRQFDLLPQLRGTRALREGLRRLAAPQWRPLRWGLVVLLLVQVLGLNAWAWQQQRDVAAKRQAINDLLKATHPQVRAVLDAPLQMQRENEALRVAAGRAGNSDLETLLAAAALAWPDGLAPAQALRFEAGQLSLTAPGAGEAQAATLRERLRSSGLEARFTDSRLVLQRSASPR